MSGEYDVAISVLAREPKVFRRILRQAKALTAHVHVDAMDGVFVRTRSISAAQLPTRSLPKKAVVHLMVNEPLRWVADIKRAGGNSVIIHREIPGFLTVYRRFRSSGWQVGIGLKSSTSLAALRTVPAVQWVHLMDGPLGQYGARRTSHWLDRIRRTRKRYPRIRLSCDIGLNPRTIPLAVQAGATEIVVGSYLWRSPAPAERWKILQAQRRNI